MFNKNIFEELINKIPNFQEKTNEIRSKSEDFIHEESGAAGLVNIKMHGSRKIVSISISDELLAMNDKKMMTDILKATINSAIDKVQAEFDARLNKSMTEFFLQSINPSQLFSDNK